MTLSEAVAIRLDELMKERNITQFRLFKLLGEAKRTLRDIRLQRNKSVSLLILHELSQGLGISLYDFFDCPLFKGNDITD